LKRKKCCFFLHLCPVLTWLPAGDGITEKTIIARKFTKCNTDVTALFVRQTSDCRAARICRVLKKA